MNRRKATTVKILVAEIEDWENQTLSYETIKDEAGSTDGTVLQWAHDRAKRFDLAAMGIAREHFASPAGQLLVYRPN